MPRFHRFHYWKLDGKIPVPTDDVMEWGIAFRNNVVKKTEVGPLEVSTVFLGIDHNFTGNGPPILFETMIFSIDEEYCRRYATWDEAETGHEKACQWARERVAQIKETLAGTIASTE